MKRYLLVIFLLAGCEGPVGPEGPAGPQGPRGEQGPQGQAGRDAEVRIASRTGTLDQDGQGVVFFPGFLEGETIVQCWQRTDSTLPWALIAWDFTILGEGETEEDVLIVSACVSRQDGNDLGVAIQGFPDWQFLVVVISD